MCRFNSRVELTEGTFSELGDRSVEVTQIFSSHISDKGLVSQTKEELSKFNSKETINAIRKWPISLAIEEMEIRTMRRYPYTPLRRANIKTNKQKKTVIIPNADEAGEELNHSDLAGRNAKW